MVGRVPRGARGLKHKSVPAPACTCRRVPRGARGLKPLTKFCFRQIFRRVPRGARGLKLLSKAKWPDWSGSRPARGAWIETSFPLTAASVRRSRPARGAWIETSYQGQSQ